MILQTQWYRMPRPSILNSIERKFILLLGDLLIIIASLGVFINDALDVKLDSFIYKALIYMSGIFFYLFLSYVLDFYNLEKSFKRRAVLSQSISITGSFVLMIFIGSVIIFDASFWRIPLLIFLFLTPLAIFLWRFFFRSLFKVIPDTKNVLYVYDYLDNKSQEKYIKQINGDGVHTHYKTKLTFSLEDVQYLEKGKFINALDKIDSFILNIQSYDKLPLEFEKILLNAVLRGKEAFLNSIINQSIKNKIVRKGTIDGYKVTALDGLNGKQIWIVDKEKTDGDTAVCNLASVNLSKVNTQEDLARVVPIATRMLDNVIDLNFYPLAKVKKTNEK